MKVSLVTFFLILTVYSQGFSQEGKLEKGKKSLQPTTLQRPSTSTSTSSTKSSSKKNKTFLGTLFGNLFIKLVTYTVYGVAFESPFEMEGRMHDAEIAHYPYEKWYQGNFIYTDSINYNTTRFDISNNFILENKNLYGNNFELDFRFFKRFSLGANYLYLTEKVNGNRDSFSLYSALLKYHRIRTQKLDAWFGLGIMHVGNDLQTSSLGLGVGVEWFIKKPVSLQFSHTWASINDDGVNSTKLFLKYHLKNYHISSGYQQIKIGVSKVNAFSVGFGISL